MADRINEGKITILYVDDEETNLMLFKLNFQRNYKVYTASTPIIGLKELEEHKGEIIVVISDMRMPLMNGVEFIRKAREKHKNIHYFILSAYDYNEEIEVAVKKREVEMFLPKPFVKEDIDHAIQRVIKGAA